MIMESVFECTLEMINKDFHEYPEHRVGFFKLLQAINYHCFPALLKLDQSQLKFVIDACMWASKHDNREVENTGLTMCIELVNNMAETDPATCNLFFHQFFIPILQDVFFVLTDTDHKAGTFHISNNKGLQDLTFFPPSRIQIASDAAFPHVLLYPVWQDKRTHLLLGSRAGWDVE